MVPNILNAVPSGKALAAVSFFSAGVVTALLLANPAGAESALKSMQAIVVCTTTGATPCVGWTNTSSGIAVLGKSVTGAAVRGVSTKNSGVLGSSTTGYGVLGQTYSGPAGVTGTSPSGYGVYGFTSGASGGIGVAGRSANGYGVYGSTVSGGYGVVGSDFNGGTGVYGGTDSGVGIQGIASEGVAGSFDGLEVGTGVSATSDTGTGLIVSSNTGVAVSASDSAKSNPTVLVRSLNSNGGDFTAKYGALVARAPATGFPLILTDPTGANNLVYVDGAGNISYRGGLFNFGKNASGATISAYSAKSTEPTVEDTGTAQLVNGEAAVHLDRNFATAIDARTQYRVFVTPGGDTRGLFVAMKTPQGFVVRESQGGRSTVSFDYRIVATALGQTGKRMATVTATALSAPYAPAPIAPIAPPRPRSDRPALPPLPR